MALPGDSGLGLIIGIGVLAVVAVLVLAGVILRDIARRRTDRLEFEERLERLAGRLEARLDAAQRVTLDGIQGTTRLFGEVSGHLGRVEEMAGRMETLAQGVHELEEILKVPKLRGLLGEVTLEALLAQVLPEPFWEAQYRFRDGRTADAVVRLRGRVVPIDAKFPLESYRRLAAAESDSERSAARRDLKTSIRARVDEIASRLIRPDEGTLDFALMYIPAEGVYSELLDEENGLLAYALERHVVPVSPGSFYAYLSSIGLGLRGLAGEERATEILAGLSTLEGDLRGVASELSVLGRHLTNAASKQGDVERQVGALLERLRRLGTDR